MELWNRVKQPPAWALKEIEGGRLSGMTDIKPTWRYQAMTEEFGPCGVGWKVEIVRTWKEDFVDTAIDEVGAFAEVNVYFKHNGEWSEPIPATGGSKLVVKEKNGLHFDDEAYKKAVTDATSTALHKLGFGADVYAGRWDGSKYRDVGESPQKGAQQATGGENWCAAHQTTWFKKGKMKGYAHPIKDENGKDTGDWCNKPETQPYEKPATDRNQLIIEINEILESLGMDTTTEKQKRFGERKPTEEELLDWLTEIKDFSATGAQAGRRPV